MVVVVVHPHTIFLKPCNNKAATNCLLTLSMHQLKVVSVMWSPQFCRHASNAVGQLSAAQTRCRQGRAYC